MPDPVLQSAAAAQTCLLVTISWGDAAWPAYADGDEPEGGVVRYAVWSDAVIDAAETFLPAESIDFQPNAKGGGAEDDGARLDLPDDLEPAKSILRFQSLRKDVVVEECDPSDVAATRSVFGRYRIAESTRRPEGRAGMTRCRLVGAKRDLERQLGVSAQPTCQHALGDHNCEVNLAFYTFPALVTDVVGRRVSAAILDSNPIVGDIELPDGWARFGRAKRGGLIYPIADHAGDTILLFDEAPAHWDGQDIEIIAGCPKTIDACRARFKNEERFLGLAIAMPSYHPSFNNRPGG